MPNPAARPLISIVMPAYNAEKFIGQSISSVQAQTMKNWELIIVDDCSSDATVAHVATICATDARIKLLKLKQNSGAAVARNTAIQTSNGRFISFLDCDDLWYPEKLEIQIAHMAAKNASFCYAGYDIIDEKGAKINTVSVPDTVRYHDLLKANRIGCLTAIYDTEYFNKVEMPLIRKRQDLGLWLKLLKKVEHAHGVNQPLAAYRKRPDSISANKISAARYTWRLYRGVEKLPLVYALYYFTHYAFNGILRGRNGRKK